MNKNQTHLKSIKNGRVFLFSATLATRSDMVPCNAKGEIASGHIGDSESKQATNERRVTKYLGNVTNGVLYPYTEILAQRDDMVSIDTEEQWAAMRETGEAPAQAPDTVAPKLDSAPESPAPGLKRTTSQESQPQASAQGDGKCSLPVIEGMGAREAKTVLSQWAEINFKAKIDRRPSLDEVVKQCEELAAKAADKKKAAG